MNGNGDFKRLNYFQGQFTVAEDWKDEQLYHVEKRKQHGRVLHTPGIAKGLAVTPHPDRGLNVLVTKGVALDSCGNLVSLAQDRKVPIPAPGDSGSELYIVIEFTEKDACYFANVQDPEYSDFTRKVEDPTVEHTPSPPAGKQLELARIKLSANATEVTVADIDCSQVQYAGAVDRELHQQCAAVQERIIRLHEYHLEKQRRHNRGLHTPGVLHGIPEGRSRLIELTVVQDAGLTVQVGAGVAIDNDGNEMYLDTPSKLTLAAPDAPGVTTRFYIAVRYVDPFAGYLTDLKQFFNGTYRTAHLEAITEKPLGSPWMELAHIDINQDTDAIREPADPANPRPGEIDRRGRRWSGAVGLVPAHLDAAIQERLTQLMQTTRRHYAALAVRFPTPSLEDTRYGALHVQMSAVTMDPEQLAGALNALAGVEQSCEHELGEVYGPGLPAQEEFINYQSAVSALLQALRENQKLDVVLDCQEAVAEAALTLSKVVFPLPTADAGKDQHVETLGNDADVTLDASDSKPGIGRKIVKYRWEKM